ncbi:MAG: hypothetical protein ORN57_01680 [Alphaproteobacteria bacterium]|nr:hypothetical protein [Alphaproteobacteria bacterium]
MIDPSTHLMIGGIYILTNNKLDPSRQNNKMHIYLGKYKEASQFLLINSKRRSFYDPCYPLLKTEYTFLQHDSYIGCNANGGIQALDPPYKISKKCGRLTRDDLKQVIDLLCKDGLDDDKYEALSSHLIRY